MRCVEAIQAAASGPIRGDRRRESPAHSTVKRALDERFGEDRRVRYVEEHRPGLACARNAGLRAARGELVAFTDDDVIVDPAWLPAIRAAFAASPEVDCVTGLILPLELETRHSCSSSASPATPRAFSRASTRSSSLPRPAAVPLYGGLLRLGSQHGIPHGGATASSADSTRYSGTGTRARGCEDLDVCIRVLNAGSRLAYEPRAVVWHRHPDTHAHLRRRAFDYGAALGAMLTKHLLAGPNRWGMVSRVPQAARYYTVPESSKNATRGHAFPASLTRLERAGLLYGPLRLSGQSLGGAAVSAQTAADGDRGEQAPRQTSSGVAAH